MNLNIQFEATSLTKQTAKELTDTILQQLMAELTPCQAYAACSILKDAFAKTQSTLKQQAQEQAEAEHRQQRCTGAAMKESHLEMEPLWHAPGHCPWRCAHSLWTEYTDRKGCRRLVLHCKLHQSGCDYHRTPYEDCHCPEWEKTPRTPSFPLKGEEKL